MATAFSTRHLTVHESISDALIRWAQGIDDADAALLGSAFTTDAIFDLSPLNWLGPSFGTTQGRAAIVESLLSGVGKLDTTHMCANFRTRVSDDGRKAKLTAYGDVTHWRPGQGRSYVFASEFPCGARYEGDLVLDGSEDGSGEEWRFTRMRLEVVWTKGDFGVVDRGSWRAVNEAARRDLGRVDELGIN